MQVLTFHNRERLCSLDRAMHPFETSLFYETWWETLSAKFPIVKRQGQLAIVKKQLFKGLCHLNALRVAGWNNHYYQSLTEERFEEFLTFHQKGSWDYLELVWNTAYTEPSAFEILKFYEYSPIHLPTMPCPVIHIPNGWEEFWNGKSSHYRRDLSKKLKNVDSLKPELIFFDGPRGIDDFFEQFFPLHWEYWEQKTGNSFFRDPLEQEFFRLWAQKLWAMGQLQLTGLVMGGVLVNLGMNIIFEDTLYCILTINTGLHQNQHPGLISMHLLIQDACERGMKKIDLGPGESHYKKKLASYLEPCSTMLVANPKSLMGQLYCHWRMRRIASIENASVNSVMS